MPREDLHKRRMLVQLDGEDIIDLLGLPPTFAPVSYRLVPSTGGVLVRMVSPSLPVVDPDDESPRLDLARSMRRVSDDQGRVWRHLGWDEEPGMGPPTFDIHHGQVRPTHRSEP